jgi:hypothetical protein
MMADVRDMSDRRPKSNEAPAHDIEAALSDEDARDLLVRRYLLGRLPESQIDAFEERFVRDRSLLDELDATEPLVEGFRQTERDGRLRLLMGHGAVRRGFFADRLSWALALGSAAALVAAVLVYVNDRVDVQELRREVADLRAPQVNPQIVDMEITRGTAEENDYAVQLPASPGWIVLAMDTGALEAQPHRARLLDAGDHVVAQSDGLEPDSFGVVYWMVHSGTLSAGRYTAEVGTADGKAEARYILRVSSPN